MKNWLFKAELETGQPTRTTKKSRTSEPIPATDLEANENRLGQNSKRDCNSGRGNSRYHSITDRSDSERRHQERNREHNPERIHGGTPMRVVGLLTDENEAKEIRFIAKFTLIAWRAQELAQRARRQDEKNNKKRNK